MVLLFECAAKAVVGLCTFMALTFMNYFFGAPREDAWRVRHAPNVLLLYLQVSCSVTRFAALASGRRQSA